jgi:hypothetical protein
MALALRRLLQICHFLLTMRHVRIDQATTVAGGSPQALNLGADMRFTVRGLRESLQQHGD